jgi:hypothetical protein
MATLLTTDADFLAAEREIAELRAERKTLDASIKTQADEARLDKPISDRIWALYDQITLSPPVSLVSAAVKLRLLADPDLGLENNEGENDVASLRQALGLVERVASDDAILALFRRWREVAELAHASQEDDGGGLDQQVWAIEEQISDTPAEGVTGLAIKIYLAAYHRVPDGGRGVEVGTLAALDTEDNAYASDGHLRLDLRSLRGLVQDAARFVPELAPFVAAVIATPTRRPPSGRFSNSSSGRLAGQLGPARMPKPYGRFGTWRTLSETRASWPTGLQFSPWTRCRTRSWAPC